jgi:hypothetical protein
MSSQASTPVSKKSKKKKDRSSKIDDIGFDDLQISSSQSSGNGSQHKVISVYKDPETSQRMIKVDMTIPALSAKMVDVTIARDGKSLLFRTYCPIGFYKKDRLTATSIPVAKRFADNHVVPQALMAAGRTVIEDAMNTKRMSRDGKGILGDPWKIRLPCKVERQLVSMEINSFNHDDRVMRRNHQGFFILSVVLEDVIKPKRLDARRVEMNMFTSPIGGANQPDSDEEEHVYDENGNREMGDDGNDA